MEASPARPVCAQPAAGSGTAVAARPSAHPPPPPPSPPPSPLSPTQLPGPAAAAGRREPAGLGRDAPAGGYGGQGGRGGGAAGAAAAVLHNCCEAAACALAIPLPRPVPTPLVPVMAPHPCAELRFHYRDKQGGYGYASSLAQAMQVGGGAGHGPGRGRGCSHAGLSHRRPGCSLSCRHLASSGDQCTASRRRPRAPAPASSTRRPTCCWAPTACRSSTSRASSSRWAVRGLGCGGCWGA